MKEKIYIILNSTLIYILAFLLTTIFHEMAHAVMGLLNNSEPVLHHNYVEHLNASVLSVRQQVMIALAGPILSLFQGLAIGLLYLKSSRQGFLSLFLLWFSVLGFNNFLGYLMTGPLFKEGDIGKVHLLLETPLVFQIILALIGASILLFIAYKLSKAFLGFNYRQEWISTKQAKKAFVFLILILPWIFGSLFITLIYLPIIAIVSIIYPVMSGMVFIFPWQNAENTEVSMAKGGQIGNFSVILVTLVILLVLFFRFFLAPGVNF